MPQQQGLQPSAGVEVSELLLAIGGGAEHEDRLLGPVRHCRVRLRRRERFGTDVQSKDRGWASLPRGALRDDLHAVRPRLRELCGPGDPAPGVAARGHDALAQHRLLTSRGRGGGLRGHERDVEGGEGAAPRLGPAALPGDGHHDALELVHSDSGHRVHRHRRSGHGRPYRRRWLRPPACADRVRRRQHEAVLRARLQTLYARPVDRLVRSHLHWWCPADAAAAVAGGGQRVGARDGDLPLHVADAHRVGEAAAEVGEGAHDADLEAEQRHAAAVDHADPPQLCSKAAFNTEDLWRTPRRQGHARGHEDGRSWLAGPAAKTAVGGLDGEGVRAVGLYGHVTRAVAAG
mmetsp:Transcript_99677/g.297765  ORF Transcript_99677/g.297765 Transcript_99677/m.297765 type:complete len:347 (-) Transcript_99677:195-1235(-)